MDAYHDIFKPFEDLSKITKEFQLFADTNLLKEALLSILYHFHRECYSGCSVSL